YSKIIFPEKTEPVSLILTFRNEEEALAANLPNVMKSADVEFEVVAVDDCSQDQSMEVLKAFKNEFPNFRISLLKQQIQNSDKMAQNLALKAAHYDWVNILPVSVNIPGENWLHEFSSRLNHENDIVVHYSNIAPAKSIYNRIYRLEMLYQQFKSFGFILNGLPFVLSQDNVAFKKQHYFDYNGYRGKISEPFAKLELVINSFINKKAVAVNISADTAITRNEIVTWKDYLELIKKEQNIKKFLPFSIRFLLNLIEWSYLLLVPFGLFSVLLITQFWPFVLSVAVILVAVHLVIIKKMQTRLKDSKIFLPSLTLGLVLPYLKLFYRISFIRYGSRKEWRIGS
ncbi:MAG TPA: glycosyltransferase, partial [Mariniphaga sp.]|nr:glycosyltransferase [Mariniphaga sp.]